MEDTLIEKIDVRAGGSQVNMLSSCFLFVIDLEGFLRMQLHSTIFSFVSFTISLSKMESQIYILGFNDLRRATACGMEVRYKLYLVILNCTLFRFLDFFPFLCHFNKMRLKLLFNQLCFL